MSSPEVRNFEAKLAPEVIRILKREISKITDHGIEDEGDQTHLENLRWVLSEFEDGRLTVKEVCEMAFTRELEELIGL